MVFGGIIIQAENMPAMADTMQRWRSETRLLGELKWTKVSRHYLEEYKSLVTLAMKLAREGRLHFKAVVFDTTQIDYSHHRNDKELGFYKFWYQFILHKFGPYAASDEDRLLVFLDQRQTSYRLATLRDALNVGIRRRFGRRPNVVRTVQAVDSAKHDLIQIADVMMGAIGYHCNDCHLRPCASPAKQSMAEHIATIAGLENLSQATRFSRKDFEIWRFRFNEKKAP